ncbi:MAG: hypothetical protein PVF34_05915 [Gammaproteobacteria bacterium]|jgi:hypothetical protein
MSKSFTLLGILAAALFAFTPGAMAGSITFGAKAGPMVFDPPGNVDISDATNAGVAVGWEQGIVVGDLGVEAEFTTTIDKGKIFNQDLEIDTFGGYVTYRSPGFIYLKGRMGFTNWEVSSGGVTDDDTSESIGVGLGFSLALIKFELDYTRIDDDIDFISIGVQF